LPGEGQEPLDVPFLLGVAVLLLEVQGVGGRGHDQVDAGVGEGGKDLQAVAEVSGAQGGVVERLGFAAHGFPSVNTARTSCKVFFHAPLGVGGTFCMVLRHLSSLGCLARSVVRAKTYSHLLVWLKRQAATMSNSVTLYQRVPCCFAARPPAAVPTS